MKIMEFLLFITILQVLGAYGSESLADDILHGQGHCNVSISSVEVNQFLREAKSEHKQNYIERQHIKYDLYTPENMNEPQILLHDDVEALRNSNFNPSWPVRFSIHGWTGKSTSCSNVAIKDAYLNRGAFNVILVDWRDIALNIDYPWVEKQFPKIAAEIAEFIKFLQQQIKINVTDTYLIGQSTGCHIAGLVGKQFKSPKLGAIVALDPIGFEQLATPVELRLAPDDALYVESIHTDVSSLHRNKNTLSQASFFPNWGHNQPLCDLRNERGDFECNHFAAVHYFAESIRQSNLFGALECPNLSSILTYNNCKCSSGMNNSECQADVYMGGEPLMPKTGFFYLSTEAYSPYGLKDTVYIKANYL